MNAPNKTSLFFVLDESYSMFPGAQGGPRFGGAGLQTFLIAEELSKDPDLEVNWVFARDDLNLDILSHPRISIRSMTLDIAHGIPYVSRFINRARRRRPFDSRFPKAIITSIGQSAPALVRYAKDAQARSILRLSSDSNVLMKSGTDPETDAMIAAYRAVDGIVVQSRFQQERLTELHGISSVYIPSIWPVRATQSSQRSTILWVASAKLIKQPWLFLVLAKRFPHEQFVMVVPEVDPEFTAYIRRECRQLPNLTLIDRQITLEQTALLFDDAKLFINTSEYEGFPNTFLQAAAASVPILSYRADPDGMLSREAIGASAQGDIMQLIALTERMLYDDTWRLGCAERARLYLERVHAPGVIAEAWKQVILGDV